MVKVNENAVKENQPIKVKEFKYIISGVTNEITEYEIQTAANCKEVVRISKLANKNLVQTQTCILTFENEIELPKSIAIRFMKNLEHMRQGLCVAKTACSIIIHRKTVAINHAAFIAAS